MVVSCSKAPVANFTTDKDEYQIGETIHLKNISNKATSYLWSGTGITGQVTTEDIEIVTNSTGIYSITLTAYSNGKKRSNVFSRGVRVRNPSGTMTFYSLNSSNAFVEIYDGTENIGYISYYLSSAPACGITTTNGVLTATLDAGPHQFLFKINGTNNYVNDTVILNSCKLHEVN